MSTLEKVIRLNEFGVRVFSGRLYNHDYLWFSFSEVGRLSTTQPFLHNYALCYALSQRSYRATIGSTPWYAQDPDGEFGVMPVYATPAQAVAVTRTTVTYNAVDTLTMTTGDSKRMNTPNLGKRVYLNPLWEKRDERNPQLGYELYVFAFGDYRLPGVFRLGKKGTPVRAVWEELPAPAAVFRDRVERPSHLVNPLDVTGRFVNYDPISVPPHLLLRAAGIQDDWFVFSGRHAVHVPRRVIARVGDRT